MKRAFWILSCFLCAVAPGGTAADPPTAPRAGEEYVLGPEDKIKITVLKHPEYDRETTVLANGKIVYQIPGGELQVAGRTRAQLEEDVRKALMFDLRNPQVVVEIVQQRSRPIYVTGSVAEPKTLEWQPGWRLRDIPPRVGGTKVKPELGKVVVRRRGGEEFRLELKRVLMESDESANFLLQPGDQIEFLDAPLLKIYLMGELKTTGPVEIPEGTSLTQVVAQAGGVTDKAWLARAMILRGSDETIPIDLRPLLLEGRVPAAGFRFQANDVLVVPERIAKFAVLGNVGAAGWKDLPENEPITVTKAISLAGGHQAKTKLSQVYLLRRKEGEQTTQRIPVDVRAVMEKGQFEKDVLVQANDVIFVPASGKTSPLDGLWLLQGVDYVLRMFGFGF